MDGVWQVLLSIGVPSSVVGFCFWIFQKKYEKREKEREEKREEAEHKREEAERARIKKDVLIIRSMGAAIALGEANACAIRDGKCNGELTAALEYAREVKHEQKDFITEIAAKALT